MAIRLLHTSDWHLGRTIDNRPRTAEFAAVLDELVGIAAEGRVDAVVLAGDIFESGNPPAEAEALFLETVLRLADAKIPLVAIAGNHDSESRLSAWTGVLRRFMVHLVPRVVPPGDGSLIELPGHDGTIARIACVPFAAERRFGDVARLFDAPESWHSAYADGVAGLIDAMSSGFRSDAVNVLVAHLFADGALLGGGERQATIGLDYAISPARLPGTASYIALGHIHRAQAVASAPAPTRYAGSLLQLDFGERGQRKSVTLVEAAPGKPARVEEVSLTAGRELCDVRGTLESIEAEAESLGDAYLRVFLQVDGPRPGLADQVRERLPNALQVILEYERAEATPRLAGLGVMPPRDQFAAWHQHAYGAPAGPDLMAAFEEVLSLVEEPR